MTVATLRNMENWKNVIGFEGRYMVSDLGRIKSIIVKDSRGQKRTPKILKQTPYRKNGKVLRLLLTLMDYSNGRHTRMVHTLVMEAFVGKRPNGYHICHNNGDSQDNRLKNLRYGSPSENEHDKIEHGTSQRGENNIKSKLTLEQVLEIKSLDLTEYGSLKKTADKYNVSSVTISHIQKGRQWAWV